MAKLSSPAALPFARFHETFHKIPSGVQYTQYIVVRLYVCVAVEKLELLTWFPARVRAGKTSWRTCEKSVVAKDESSWALSPLSVSPAV